MNKRGHEDWGAAAVGASGGVVIEVDHTIDGPEVWGVAFTLAHTTFSLRWTDPARLLDILAFLKQTAGVDTHREILLDAGSRGRVSFVKDNEGGRYFLRMNGAGHKVWVSFTGEEMNHLTVALSDVVDQLDLQPAAR